MLYTHYLVDFSDGEMVVYLAACIAGGISHLLGIILATSRFEA